MDSRVSWIAITPDGAEVLGSPEEAEDAAERWIQEAEGGEWPADVEVTSWGVFIPLGEVEQFERIDTPGGDYDYLCRYRLREAFGAALFRGCCFVCRCCSDEVAAGRVVAAIKALECEARIRAFLERQGLSPGNGRTAEEVMAAFGRLRGWAAHEHATATALLHTMNAATAAIWTGVVASAAICLAYLLWGIGG